MIGKVFAGIVTAGVLAGVLATGAMAAPAATAAANPAKTQRPAAKDVFGGTKYFEITGKHQRKAGSLTDIKAGMRLVAAGSYDSSHNFDAAVIAYRNT